ncbi:MAG TPA: 16S rRNA (cytosine(1402)-N(4))-methyltransferase RsmH [Patescibacteria group bacterium]|nr:16S rRNA (cytosine(1402)-N(4))-methyltransferase RsmH [Patescibacteria group bacterium]
MVYFHQPVLLEEVIKYLNPRKNQNYIDGTVGGGGHAKAILERISPRGHLLGLDRDPEAIQASKQSLSADADRVLLVQKSYTKIKEVIYEQRLSIPFTGCLLDLGLSSFQVSAGDERGFSFQEDRPLDMRFGPETDLTAKEILNTWSQDRLIQIFKDYGQEPRARAVAREILLFRARKPIELTSELVQIISRAVRGRLERSKGRIHPATKVFQALRIAVNDELANLRKALPDLLEALEPKGRLVIISYHSLEDRIVKQFFKQESTGCICPKEIPECRCNHRKSINILTKKPISPTEGEIKSNPRSRSAKLRALEKL